MIVPVSVQLMESYIDSVLDESTVVGSLVRAAVNRHVNDLARESTQEFPYHFDRREVNRVLTFFPVALRHSIGEWAGQPFELTPWQAFIVGQLFGWKRDSENTRRFRRAYCGIARKNGKSTLAAGIGLLLTIGDNEAGAQVLVSATKIEQAHVVFGEAKRMVDKSPAIKSRMGVKSNCLTFHKTGSYMRPVGSDKPFDGLNPHGVILDELHAWREFHRPFYDTMVTGGAARKQPLQVVITTAGDDQSQLWIEEYEYGRKVVLGEAVDEAMFCFSAEVDDDDDPLEEANWAKSNPNLGISVKLDYLRQQATEAKAKPMARNRFIRYHANKKVSSTEAAIDLVQWDRSVSELSNWKTADAIGIGLDLGGRDDLSAYAIVARFLIDDQDSPQYRYEFQIKPFMDRNSKRDLTQQPFAAWIYTGNLDASEHPVTKLQTELIQDAEMYGCFGVAYDPFNAMQLAENLDQYGINTIKMAQNCNQFNEPIREFLKAMGEDRVRHDGINPVSRWSAGNAVIRRDSQDKWMFCKRTSKEKIDPIVALIMAFRVAMTAPSTPQGSLYIT